MDTHELRELKDTQNIMVEAFGRRNWGRLYGEAPPGVMPRTCSIKRMNDMKYCLVRFWRMARLPN